MLLQQLINGVTVGGSYALIALGYTMVYGILRIVNFAHGDVFMMGAFFGLFCMKVMGMSYLVAFPVAALATAVLGILMERIAYRPIRMADSLTVMISALGVSTFLGNLAMVLWGTGTHAFSNYSGITVTTYTFDNVVLSNIQIGFLLIALVLMAVLYTVVNKTKVGVAMRATSHSIKSAKLMGVNTDRIISFTFGVGSALACVAGLLVGIYYDAVYPLIGYSYGLKAFAAAVLGGDRQYSGSNVGRLYYGDSRNSWSFVHLCRLSGCFCFRYFNYRPYFQTCRYFG